MLIPLGEEALASRKSSWKNPKTYDLLSTNHSKKTNLNVLTSAGRHQDPQQSNTLRDALPAKITALSVSISWNPSLSRQRQNWIRIVNKNVSFSSSRYIENYENVIHIFVGSFCCLQLRKLLKNTEANMKWRWLCVWPLWTSCTITTAQLLLYKFPEDYPE